MPYIEDDRRQAVDAGARPENGGELTYWLYKGCLVFIEKHGKKFATFCVVVGALVCTLLELYRRIVAPYEDEKRFKNGDVH